ncbi:MAG TPA: KTSC domain-containing protein [Dongiaceae bacterium]|nr:KTSC domain-containing protein [Dongiaceae bacterium]
MERAPIKSSVIAAVGYDPKFQWLEVELKTGNLYLYREVPANIHQAFMAALSKGSFYNLYVRDDYPFVRVR